MIHKGKKESYSDPSAPSEFRLNYLKNFNHLSKDQLGAMEIFGPRTNSEIQRIQDEVIEKPEKEKEQKKDNKERVVGDETKFNYPKDRSKGLTISSDQERIPRQHSYPYGFGSPPLPTYTMSHGIRSKTSNNNFKLESFKNMIFINNIYIKSLNMENSNIKSFEEFNQPKGTGAESTWTASDGFTVSLDELMEYVKDPIDLKVSDIEHLLIDAERDPKRVENANLDFPILIGFYKGSYVNIIDGHHRLAKSIKHGKDTIKAQILDFSEVSQKIRDLFKIRESMVHDNSLRQLRDVSTHLNGIDIGTRVSDRGFANALNTKKDITKSHVQTYQEYMNEPFQVNQNRKPWEERTKK